MLTTSSTAALLTGDPPRAGGAASYRRIALVGNPNVGKSVIFGYLTGRYATVSNYPGTTVEVARAPARLHPEIEIIDTPGVHTLVPDSEDERVTRDILLEGVDVVVQIADAKSLARSLVLTLQLAEAALPLVLVVNMTDEAADRGIHVDVQRLSAELGVPVVETVAVSGHGLHAIERAIERAATSPSRVVYPAPIEAALAEIAAVLPANGPRKRWLGLVCLAGDETLRPWLAQKLPAEKLAAIESVYQRARMRPGVPIAYELRRQRLRAAECLARRVTAVSDGAGALEGSDHLVRAGAFLALIGFAALLLGDLRPDSVLRQPQIRPFGWLMLFTPVLFAGRSAAMRAAIGRWAAQPGFGLVVVTVVLYVVYRFVGVFAAGTVVDVLEETAFGRFLNPAVTSLVDAAFGSSAAEAGWSATLLRLVRDLFVGPYGVVTMALTYALAIILPVVTAFFLAFSVLEDSGYLPRLAVVVHRTFRMMGISGKAVLPMVLGLGCDTMATLTARIMETRKERLLVTLLLALGIPCSAQLGVILGLFGALPLWAPIVWAGVVLLVLFIVGFLAARLLPGDRSDLILELPPIRRPHFGNVTLKTLARLEWYLKEAVPIFVLGTLVLFALDAAGLLVRIIRMSEPVVVGVLGLPPRAAEAFLLGFFRRDYGSAGLYALFEQGMLSPAQTVVSLVTMTLFVPCIANFFVIVKERGLRTALAVSGFIFPFAFAVGGAVQLGLSAVGLR
jgi:ferrous iron transport protein B